MAHETSTDTIKRYLEDAIAAEKNFESQLKAMSEDGDEPEVQRIFAAHADETRLQHQRLERRLEELGGSASTLKSMLAHVFNAIPKAAQFGHDKAERTTQNLIIAYAIENSEVALYESLICAADAAGDTMTAKLGREIQEEERVAANKVWSVLGDCARRAFLKVTSESAAAAAS